MTKIKLNKKFKIKKQAFYNIIRHNNIEKINTFLPIEHLKDYTFYNSHGPTPMLKSLCEEVYNQISIDDTISSFRENNNLTQELFTIYALLKRKLILLKNCTNPNRSTNVSSGTIFNSENMEKMQNYLFFEDYYCKQFCINDNFENNKLLDDTLLLSEVEKQLSEKFSIKSKYEKKI
jgi:hypothetical protein